MSDDLISRRALYERAATLEAQALDYVGKLIERDGEETSVEWRIWSAILTERTAFKHDVYDAPSAQPEYWFDEWCTDCKEYDHERHCCPRFNHVIRTTLQDVQAELYEKDWTFDDDTKQITFVVPIDVYNATQTIFISPGYEGETGLRGKVFLTQPEKCEDCGNFNKTRLLIPQQEQKKGKWIVNSLDYKSVCSVCGADETKFIHGTEMWYGLGKSKFCPNCGARMEVEE